MFQRIKGGISLTVLKKDGEILDGIIMSDAYVGIWRQGEILKFLSVIGNCPIKSMRYKW